MAHIKEKFRNTLKSSGIFSALSLINRLSVHRYTALFKFQDNVLKSVCIIDREDGINCKKEWILPLSHTYCQFVLVEKAPVEIVDAIHDERLTEHPHRELVQSYCGYPIFDSNGEVIGTVCLFDTQPLKLSLDEFTILSNVAEELSDYLQKI